MSDTLATILDCFESLSKSGCCFIDESKDSVLKAVKKTVEDSGFNYEIVTLPNNGVQIVILG